MHVNDFYTEPLCGTGQMPGHCLSRRGGITRRDSVSDVDVLSNCYSNNIF